MIEKEDVEQDYGEILLTELNDTSVINDDNNRCNSRPSEQKSRNAHHSD